MTADEFNATHPPGTPVLLRRAGKRPYATHTRGIAWTIVGTPVVTVAGIVGVVRVADIGAPNPTARTEARDAQHA